MGWGRNFLRKSSHARTERGCAHAWSGDVRMHGAGMCARMERGCAYAWSGDVCMHGAGMCVCSAWNVGFEHMHAWVGVQYSMCACS